MSKEFPISELNLNTDQFITDADVARELVDSVQSRHAKLWELIKLMEDHIDGKKPKDAEKMRAAGGSWQSNFNFGKARSKIEGVVSSGVDTVLNSMMLMSVAFKPLSENDLKDESLAFLEMPDLRDYAASCIEACINDLLEFDPRVLPFISMLEYNSTAWGWAAALRDKRSDYLGKAQHIRSIGFTDKVRADNPGDFVCLDNISGKELWQLYSKNVTSANVTRKQGGNGTVWHESASGWIREGLEEALFFAYKGAFDEKGNPSGMLSSLSADILPEFMKSPSLGMLRTEAVNIARIVNFEMAANKVTFTVIAYGNGWKSESKNGATVRYMGTVPSGATVSDHVPKYMLYQRTVKVDSKLDVLDLVVDSGFSTNGMLQDMKGLARHAVEDGIRHNRTKNDLLDKLRVSGSAAIEPENQIGGRTAPRIAPHGGFLVMDSQYKFSATQPKFDLSNHIAVLSLDENEYQRETEGFDPRVSGKLTSRPVTKEVEVVSGEVRRIEGTRAGIKLKSYGRVILGIIRSMAYHLAGNQDSTIAQNPDAQKGYESFKERLKEYLKVLNITEDKQIAKLLEQVDSVQLVAALSDPQAIIEQISMAERPYDRIKFNRMLMIARGFSRRDVAERWPLLELPTNMNDEWMAALENDALQNTSEVVFSPSHHHIAHLNIHFPKCFALIEQIMQTPDPVSLFNWLNRLVEHSGFHVDSILKTQYIVDETKAKYLNSYKQLLSAVEQIKKQIQELARQMAQQQQQQQAEQQTGQQPLDPKVQNEIEESRIKLANSQQIKLAQSEFRQGEMAKNNEQRRRQAEESHQEKLRRARDLEELKKEVTILRESIKMSAA